MATLKQVGRIQYEARMSGDNHLDLLAQTIKWANVGNWEASTIIGLFDNMQPELARKKLMQLKGGE